MRSVHHMPNIDSLERLAWDFRTMMVRRGDRWEVRAGRSTYWTEADA